MNKPEKTLEVHLDVVPPEPPELLAKAGSLPSEISKVSEDYAIENSQYHEQT